MYNERSISRMENETRLYRNALRLLAEMLLGREVTARQELTLHPGIETPRWDGLTDDVPAASGVYFLRLEGPNVNLTRKVFIVR